MQEDQMRAIRLIVLLSVLALLITPAIAGGQGSQDMGAGGKAAMGEQQAEGSISSIDQAAKTMKVQPAAPGAAPMTLHFSDKTKVMDQMGKEVKVSALKEGDRIRASYMREAGKDMASKIEMLPAAGAPGAPPSGAAPKGGAGGGM
jgi:hypothetical protein